MANRRKRTPEELEEMRKWRKMPWKVTSVVMQPDGSTRPYDPERDLVDHIVQPLADYWSDGTIKASWKPEHLAMLAEKDRRAAANSGAGGGK